MRMLGYAVLLSISLSANSLAVANEVEGFRLGMSMQQVSQLALEKGYKFSSPVKSSQN